MLGLGLSLQKGISAFNAGRALVSSYIRRVTDAGGVLQNTACDAAAINELNQDRLLEPASWVLVPDGIEEDIVFAQKPTSGLGDLTFTRASDATYTDSTGVVRRSPYNLLQQSEAFDNGVWGKLSGSTVTANQATAPNGTLTADLITEGTSVLVYFALNTFRAGTYTQSYYAKKGTGDIFGMYFGSGFTSRFNLTLGTIISATNTTATIQDVGNGWYRCTATATPTADFYAGISYSNSSGSTIYAWGAQLVEGSSALDYFPTTNRQDVPRIDFRNADGTLSSCGRLLLEPQRTNSIRNSSMVGAVAGSPGTLPTNWGNSISGLTQTVVGIGTENGLPYIDFRFNGTASGTLLLINFEGSSIISAANAQTWTNAFYFKTIAAPQAPLSYNLHTIQRSSGTNVGSFTLAFTPTTTLTRYAQTVTTNQATITHIQPYFFATLTIGQTYDFTIRIAAPQMELGAYATTFIPTTTAAVTRIQDGASKAGVASLIGQTEGTMFVDFNYYPGQNIGRLISVTETAIPGNNRLIINVNSSNNRVSVISRQNNTITNGSISESVATQISAGRNKIALGYQSGNSVLYINGVQVGTNTDSFTFTVALNRLFTMTSELSLIADNLGYVNQAALFPTRLTNDQLEVLTSEGYGTYALLAQSLNCVLQ